MLAQDKEHFGSDTSHEEEMLGIFRGSAELNRTSALHLLASLRGLTLPAGRSRGGSPPREEQVPAAIRNGQLL
ncbi:hypothetical protein D9X91_03920 [Falsibacillus albus]|uniref:Uncharacterized protein n=1 Tax=Falsibacillus albus TaxID=2478915 RepID=A0A3L7K2L4_9BACI|nr:hypothetical protein D9X91_03920 [Falsibacillus albus]